MTARQALHRLIDELPEQDVEIASRILGGLKVTEDPVLRALLTAPPDDEPDDDDFDGGLTEARRQVRDGELLDHEEVKRDLGLS